MSSNAIERRAPEREANQTECWPVLVHLRKTRVSSGRWEVDSWSLAGVDSDRDNPGAQICFERVEASQGAPESSETFCWRGLSLVLYRDERDAYRFNLSSSNPRLFVNCNADDDGFMEPQVVTASQDVAASYMDGGEEDVFSIAMPLAIQCWIEAFIARHGEPDMMLGKSRRRRHGGGRKEERRDG